MRRKKGRVGRGEGGVGLVAEGTHDGAAAVGKPAIGDGALQPGEQSRQPDGSKSRPEAGEIEREADAVGSVRLNETWKLSQF